MNAIDRLSVPLRDSLGAASGSAHAVETAPKQGEWQSPKSKPRHLQRLAVVYIRQSTPHQVIENSESLARQYALRDRAVALGWPISAVLVIDDDLGLSGGGSQQRLGFQRLLAEVAQDRVGLVLALEMSRLARNSRDWHSLFDLCAMCDVLLADEDGVYDPSDINDRLILGMKGIMSEMELHVMKSRLERGRRNKAQRGELFHAAPWGYVLMPDGTITLDPDEQVRATVRRLFDTFQTLGSAYAVVNDLRRHDVKLPMRDASGSLVWRRATATIVTTTLHHPLYAGAYSWGRRQTRTRVDLSGRIGRSRRSRPLEEWLVLLHDRVPAYITWVQYLSNQKLLRENQSRRATKGAPRRGFALLPGLLFCGKCGRKMQVEYRQIRLGRYACSSRRDLPYQEACGGIPARGVDELITRLVLQALSPAGIELSLRAIEQTSQHRREQEAHLRRNLERATYEAERAERQYQAVEPENRLVARTLEERWEAALRDQSAAREASDRFLRDTPIALSNEERRSLEELSIDIPRLWRAPETTADERKAIVRCLIERVELTQSESKQEVELAIRWAGGFESRHQFRRAAYTYQQITDVYQLLSRITELRGAGWRSPRIAEQLNAEGFKTPKQCGGFTDDVVRYLYRRVIPGARAEGRTALEPPLWPVEALAETLMIPVKRLKDWVRSGYVRAVERPFGGVWILHADERELRELKRRVALCRKGAHYPADLQRKEN